VQADTLFWILARVTGLSASAALAISLLTGLALRSAVLDWLASNRAVRATHEFTAILWIPLGLLHPLFLVLDGSVRQSLGLVDLVVPFGVPYGTFAIGLGTLAFDIVVLVAVTGWLRRRISPFAWRWLHRLAYLACALLFLHALLAGTDFSAPQVSAIAWSVTAILAVLSVARLLWGHLSADVESAVPESGAGKPARPRPKRSQASRRSAGDAPARPVSRPSRLRRDARGLRTRRR
jgi:sulfoxide reductase heme-binding subunit YedZ